MAWGVPVTPVSSEYDFVGLVWVVGALLVTRFVLDLPLTVPNITVSLIVATLWWAAVGRWGLVPPSAMLVVGLWLLSRLLPAGGPRG